MLLRVKLRSMKLDKRDSIFTYLTKLAQIKDELETMGEAVDETKLMRTTLNGFTNSGKYFSVEWWLRISSLIRRYCGMNSPGRS
jgi:hypothetical protein